MQGFHKVSCDEVSPLLCVSVPVASSPPSHFPALVPHRLLSSSLLLLAPSLLPGSQVASLLSRATWQVLDSLRERLCLIQRHGMRCTATQCHRRVHIYTCTCVSNSSIVSRLRCTVWYGCGWVDCLLCGQFSYHFICCLAESYIACTWGCIFMVNYPGAAWVLSNTRGWLRTHRVTPLVVLVHVGLS